MSDITLENMADARTPRGRWPRITQEQTLGPMEASCSADAKMSSSQLTIIYIFEPLKNVDHHQKIKKIHILYLLQSKLPKFSDLILGKLDFFW